MRQRDNDPPQNTPQQQDHAYLGTVPGVRCPIRFVDEDPVAKAGPPFLGQHTAEVLASLARLDDQRLDALMRAGIVAGMAV